MSENLVKNVFISLGSNLGDRLLNIEKTKFLIHDENTQIISTSSIYETVSWPNKIHPKYLNLVLKLKTNLKPHELLHKFNKIEKSLGRIRREKNYPRTCDIDILDYDKKKINSLKTRDLQIPHPRLHKRIFVLIPLHELDKNWTHPLNDKKICVLLDKFKPKAIKSIKVY